MIEVSIRAEEEYIKLGQALKKAGLVEVNGEKELQRGKKLRDGDIVSYNGETIKICK